MTPTQRAQLEATAREWLNKSNLLVPYDGPCYGVHDLAELLAAQRAAVMEEAAAICHAMALKEGFSNITNTDDESDMRKTCAWMMDQCAAVLKQQAQESRP